MRSVIVDQIASKEPMMMAAMIDVTVERAERIYRDIDTKRTTTRYLHRRPLLAGEVAEVRE